MPYTFAHIGFVLPFKKKWPNSLSITGLIFGSIAPDYDILFRFTNNRFHLFQFDLATILLVIYPLAFLSAIAFHSFCRDILIRQLPALFRERSQQYLNFNFTASLKDHFFRISLSILLGICVHLILDYLCHHLDAYYTKQYFFKYTHNEQILQFVYYAAIYLLPVLFTLAGFFLLYRFLFPSPIRLRDLSLSWKALRFWGLLFFVSVFISFLKIFFMRTEKDFYIDFIIISFTSSIIISVYLVCSLYYIQQRFQKKETR